MFNITVIITDSDLYLLRLVGGKNSNEGRVEVLYNSAWLSICLDLWDTNDAKVVCRQLGLPHENAEALGMYAFGHRLTAWLGSVNCSGVESNLNECSQSMSDGQIGWELQSCSNWVDSAGVRCIRGA